MKFKKFVISLMTAIFLVAGIGCGTPTNDKDINTSQTQNVETVVYITNTGSKYHSEGCKYLKKSQISIKLSDAKAKGFEPCSVCHPAQ